MYKKLLLWLIFVLFPLSIYCQNDVKTFEREGKSSITIRVNPKALSSIKFPSPITQIKGPVQEKDRYFINRDEDSMTLRIGQAQRDPDYLSQLDDMFTVKTNDDSYRLIIKHDITQTYTEFAIKETADTDRYDFQRNDKFLNIGPKSDTLHKDVLFKNFVTSGGRLKYVYMKKGPQSGSFPTRNLKVRYRVKTIQRVDNVDLFYGELYHVDGRLLSIGNKGQKFEIRLKSLEDFWLFNTRPGQCTVDKVEQVDLNLPIKMYCLFMI